MKSAICRTDTYDTHMHTNIILGSIKAPTLYSAVTRMILCACCFTADVRVGGADSPTGNLLFSVFGRSRDFNIRAEADQIGQEGTETITIPLAVTSTSPRVFVGPPATVTVIDQSGKLCTTVHLLL